jgi:predicted enzyme related to lactoylglutathione lyase
MTVSETFVSIEVHDMGRATAFYVAALGAIVKFPSPGWTSLIIAGVRIGLFLHPSGTAGRTGLHFSVGDLAEACAEVERAGGRVVAAASEVAPGVVIAEASDTEGNSFTLVRR